MGNKWRGFMVATVAAAWLAVPGAVQPASAALISGQFSMTGTDIWNNATNTLGVSSGSVNTGTGDFARVGRYDNNLQSVQPCRFMPVHKATNIIQVAQSLLSGLLYTGSNGLTFTINNSAFAENITPPANLPDLSILATGVLTLTGRDNTPGEFALTTQGGGDGTTTVTFSATTVAVPGPVLGAGLPGLVWLAAGFSPWRDAAGSKSPPDTAASSRSTQTCWRSASTFFGAGDWTSSLRLAEAASPRLRSALFALSLRRSTGDDGARRSARGLSSDPNVRVQQRVLVNALAANLQLPANLGEESSSAPRLIAVRPRAERDCA